MVDGTAGEPNPGLLRPAEVVLGLFESEWGGLDPAPPVVEPTWVETGNDAGGNSDRRVPSNIRAKPAVFSYGDRGLDREAGDIHHETEDSSATVRLEVVVAKGQGDLDGDDTRDAYLAAFERIRRANSHPPGGVGGTRWSGMEPGTIDRSPTEYSQYWEAYYDLELEAFAVL